MQHSQDFKVIEPDTISVQGPLLHWAVVCIDPMIFRFKIGQFPFHTLTNSVRQPIFTGFAAF